MKIAYLTAVDLYKEKHGSAVCEENDIRILQELYGEENVNIVILSRYKESQNIVKPNVKIFYARRDKLSIMWRLLTSDSLWWSRKTGRQILDYLSELRADCIFNSKPQFVSIIESLNKRAIHVLRLLGTYQDWNRVFRTKRHYQIMQNPLVAIEQRAVQQADVVIMLTQRDSDAIKKHYGRGAELILPAVLYDEFPGVETTDSCHSKNANCTDTEEDKRKLQLLFVGSTWGPNVDGVTWFVENVMPHIDAQLTIVGSGFERLRDKLTRGNVNVIGFAESISDYYLSCDAVVPATFVGTGIKVKTCEALMYGKPMFAPDEALVGYDVDDLENVHRCNTAEEFIKAINAFAKKEARVSFDERIRERFLVKYNAKVYMQKLKSVIEKDVKEI